MDFELDVYTGRILCLIRDLQNAYSYGYTDNVGMFSEMKDEIDGMDDDELEELIGKKALYRHKEQLDENDWKRIREIKNLLRDSLKYLNRSNND